MGLFYLHQYVNIDNQTILSCITCYRFQFNVTAKGQQWIWQANKGSYLDSKNSPQPCKNGDLYSLYNFIIYFILKQRMQSKKESNVVLLLEKNRRSESFTNWKTVANKFLLSCNAWNSLIFELPISFSWQGAKMIAEQGGRFPRTVSNLKKVPGIGDYTAGAIASIAFKEVTP